MTAMRIILCLLPLWFLNSACTHTSGYRQTSELTLEKLDPKVSLGHVEIDDVVIESIAIPHRAELSDMHAFVIRGKEHSVLFLPDHDSWDQTLSAHNASSIRKWLNDLDITHALLDGTFWSGDELQGRDMSVVPHPTIQDSLARLGQKQNGDPEIFFTHLNHTNPAHQQGSAEYQNIVQLGWRVSVEGEMFIL